MIKLGFFGQHKNHTSLFQPLLVESNTCIYVNYNKNVHIHKQTLANSTLINFETTFLILNIDIHTPLGVCTNVKHLMPNHTWLDW